MPFRAYRNLAVVFLCFFLWPSVGLSQMDRSTLVGTVTDQSGARIPKAAVRATQAETGLQRDTSTSAQGTYVLYGLPIGRYVVTIAAAGFAQLRVEQITQEIGKTQTLDVQLSLTRSSQDAVVRAELVQLDRSSAAVSAPIEQAQVKELPLNGRNWSHLTSLVPGATDTGPSDQRTIRFAGHGLDDNNFTIDGVDTTGVLNQAEKEYVRLAIPLDSINEFQVQAQNYNVDMGTSPGGQVAVASRAGTNAFRGNAFDYLRNDVIDARSPFDGKTAAPFVLNQFGGDVAGAIVQNKTFFFANYEGLRQRLGQTQIGLVPSPGFIATAALLSPALQPLLSEYPKGTSPTANPNIWNYVAGANQVDNEDSGMFRIDQHFSERTTAFLRFSADEADYKIPTGALNALADTDSKLKNGVVELLHVFSSRVVSEAHFGFNQDQFRTANTGTTPFSVRVAGFSNLTNNETTDGQGTTFSYLDDTTWAKGRHTFKFGVLIRRINMNQGNTQNGILTYSGTGAIGNFLIDQANSATFASSLPLKRMRKTQAYGYIQDEYKVLPRLTLTVGLRYSFFNVFHEVDNRAIPFDLETCGGFCARGTSFSNPRTDDFDPRLGLAWSHANTVVRLGAGIYHGDGQEDDQNLPIANDVGRYTLSRTTTPTLAYPVAPFLAATTGIVTPRDFYRNRKDFYVASWTASVQQQLPGRIVATLSYLGNKGTDVLTTTYQNIALAGPVPFPQFGTVEFRKNDGNSNFHAMQFNARRAFEKGWLLSTNYMWSHSINDDSIGGGESDTPQNVFCRACEKASSDFDVRQVFNANVVYELPWGAGKHWLSQPGFWRSMVGGWQISGVGTARTGLPVNVTYDPANSAVPGGYAVSGSERPNLIPGISLYPANGRTRGSWINPAAFALPAAGTFGNAGRNLLNGPGLWQIDASLAKRFVIAERVALQARAEGYNLANRAQYGNPNADISSTGNFGQITTPVNQGATGSGTPRQFQFALKLSF